MVSILFLLLLLASFTTQSFFGGMLFIALSAVLFSVPFYLIYFLRKYIGYQKALLLLPLVWPVFEWFVLEKTFELPLLSLASRLAVFPSLVQYVDITGYTGISMWVLILNVALYLTLDKWFKLRSLDNPEKKKKEKIVLIRRLSLVVLACFLLPLIYYSYVKNTIPDQFKKTIRVSVIQSNFALEEDTADSVFTEFVKSQITLTDSIVQKDSTDLIVWPEGGIPYAFKEHRDNYEYFFSKVLIWQKPMLSGTFDKKYFKNSSSIPALQRYLNRDYEIYNSAVLITQQLAYASLVQGRDISSLKLYRKRNLMQFTEHVPLSETFPFLSNFSIIFGGNSNFSPGTGSAYLHFADKDQDVINVSPIICWDVLFGSSTTHLSDENDFIAALTNESRLGNIFTAATHGMESFTQLRSIESRRSIVKAATTGFSIYTDPFGRIYRRLALFNRGAVTDKVILSNAVSFYSQYPNAFPILCLIILIVYYLKHFFFTKRDTVQ